MPHTVGQVGLTTLALIGALALCYLAEKRWGVEESPDALLVLWHRWRALGTLRTRPLVKEVKEPLARRRARVHERVTRMRSESVEHVPLGAVRKERERDTRAEPKLSLRHRFRRGMRRTREEFGREVKQAFKGGTTAEAFERLEDALVAADVGVLTATMLCDELRLRRDLTAETATAALRDVMVTRLEGADRRLKLVRGKLSVWVVVGVNGTGKTTTIAKLASRSQSLGLSVCLAAADTFRAAGVEQLVEWGKRLGVDVIAQSTGADPGAVVFDAIAHAKAEGHDLLIVDTAGRLHTRKPLMAELKKVIRVIERDQDAALAETLLTIDATTGQNGITQARAFGEAVGVTGLVLAKLDGTAKGGITFAVENELGIPVKAVGVGERDRDLIPFEPESFVDAILGEGE